MMEGRGSSLDLEDTCPPLLNLCMKLMKAFEFARAHLKPVPLTLMSLANECFALHRALAKVRRFDLQKLGLLEEVRRQQLLDSLEAFFLGCNMTLSAVNELAEELRQHAIVVSVTNVGESPITPNLKLQQFWKEDDMKEFLVQIREYRSGLIDLLTEAQSDINGSEESLRTGNETIAVLDLVRSQDSHQPRPSSIRSSDQGSLLDPSPPYAISLHEYTTDYAYSAITPRLPTPDHGQSTILSGGEEPLILQILVTQTRDLSAKDKSEPRNVFLVFNIGISKQEIFLKDWKTFHYIPIVGVPRLRCVCWDRPRWGKDYIGEFDIAVEDIFTDGKVQQEPRWYTLHNPRRSGDDKKTQVSGEVQIRFALVDSANAAASPEEIYEKFRKVVGADHFDRHDASTDVDDDESDGKDQERSLTNRLRSRHRVIIHPEF